MMHPSAIIRAPAFALLLVLAGPASATEAGSLYEARTIVTGQGEASRTAGFARCLEDVLVKVSGDPRLAGDPAVAALGARAADLVVAFRFHDRMSGIPVHDEQGTRERPYDLTVDFDPAGIAAALAGIGRAPWAGPRPRLVLFVGVKTGDVSYVLASDADRGRDLRDALADAGERYGMTVVLPGHDVLAGPGLDFAALERATPQDMARLASAAGGDVAVAGILVWDDRALGWTAIWRLEAGGTGYRWQVGGVSFDKAFQSAVGGAMGLLSGHGPPG